MNIFIYECICIYIYIYIYIYVCACVCINILRVFSKELTAVTRVMLSSSNELSTLVSNKTECKQSESHYMCVIIPEMAEWLDAMSS